jgi:hypothetical protein
MAVTRCEWSDPKNGSHFNNTEKNLSFDQLDVLEDILNAAIENGDNTIDVSQLKVVDEF